MHFLSDIICLKREAQQCAIASAFICFFSLQAFAATPINSNNTLSLESAFNKALNANPDIAASIHQSKAMAGMRMQAGAIPNPSLSTELQDTKRETRETTISITQKIELGNKRGARLAVADILLNKSNVEIEHKKAKIHADVVAAFYAVLAAQESFKLSQSALHIASLSLEAASKRVNAGKSSPVEETKSKIAKSSATIEMQQAKSQLNQKRKQLSMLWAEPIAHFDSVHGHLQMLPEMGSLSTLLAMLDSAPATKLAMMEMHARDAITMVERSKAVPNITISAGVVNNQELNGRNQALLGLSVPIPLFDRNQGNVHQALNLQYKAEDAFIALKAQLSTELASQHDRFTTAKQTAELLREEILPNAESAFRAANKGFRAGKFSFLDVLDAQRTLFQVQSQYTRALLEAHQSTAEIERILGDVIKHPRKVEE